MGNESPENASERGKKDEKNCRLVHKNRRNLNRNGCIRDLKEDLGNLKLKESRIEEKSCGIAGMVSILELSFKGSFGRFSRDDLILKL